MRRRGFGAFVGALATASTVRPSLPGAQQKAMPTIGVLMIGGPGDPEYQLRLKAFRDGLSSLGWIDGTNVHIDYRWSRGEASALDRQAAELVALKPDVILANGTPAVMVLRKVTSTVPIVCALVQDPVRLGFVASLARPGGNITGFTYVNPELIEKWRELLADLAPATKRAALLFDPSLNPQYYDFLRDLGPARPGTIDLVATPVQTAEALRSVMAELGRTEGAAVIQPPDPFVLSNRKEIAALALHYRLPSVAVSRLSAVDGGLMSYGPDTADIFARAASYIDRILKGANPAELPMQQPDKFEFVINMKAARALGLAVPPLILARADEVLE